MTMHGDDGIIRVGFERLEVAYLAAKRKGAVDPVLWVHEIDLDDPPEMNDLHLDCLRTGAVIREGMIPMVITYEEREAVAVHLDQTCPVAARWVREPAVGHGMTVVITAGGELSVHDCIARTENE